MKVAAFFRRVRRTLHEFGAARGGNVAITFAFATLPIIGFVGAAVDYSNSNSVKSAMQSALDSTALMLSKEAATDTADQLTQNAKKYFAALFSGSETPTIDATYSNVGGSSVVVNGTVAVPTTFMNVLGYNAVNVGASSTVKWGSARLRVALVLDNTGSMASANKMTALKTAAANFLTQLKTAAVDSTDVYVSIIPFAKGVNVGTTSSARTWISSYIKWSGESDTWDEVNGTCNSYTSGWGQSAPTDKSSCTSRKGTWTSTSHSNWGGCVMDRTQSYDATNTAPATATPATLFPAYDDPSSDPCPVPVMGLSNDWTALNNKITAMTPTGGTNQAIGLQWGYQSLTASPFTIPAYTTGYTYTKIIILLTDGLNTEDRWYGDGQSHSQSVDDRQTILCSNIKAAGITMYTVQVNTSTPADPTSTLLQNCASSTDKFFMLTSSSAIATTFNTIGTNLTQLRVAK